ncbi:MAG: hypothetical protein EOO04_33830, partial [Chitinophagaceae bacterium]
LENYIDFFNLFFNEDPAAYAKLSPMREKRLALLKKGPVSSPWYRFSSGVVHFQWAVVRIKFGYNWDGGWEFRRAYVDFRDNDSRFPDFLPNKMYRSAMQVAAGTIPDGYRWLSNMLGIRGTIKEGMEGLRSFLANDHYEARLYREESIFYFCYLSFYVENDKEGVLRFINDQQLDVKNNHLFAYLAANLSIHNQQAETALNIIDQRNNSPDYFTTPVWDLEKGYVLLYKGDAMAALSFERFVQRFKGRYYVKDAFQKLAWHYYLAGDPDKASAYRKQLLNSPGSNSEADKQAHREAESGQWPNKLLLRARLFNDGGYHREALRLLHGKSEHDFPAVADQLEFYYRAARIYDELGNSAGALRFYELAIKLGRARKEYYAARAALQSGFIYEKQKQFDLARQMFLTVLAMKDHEFKNSIDQKAKAGLNRCREALPARAAAR